MATKTKPRYLQSLSVGLSNAQVTQDLAYHLLACQQDKPAPLYTSRDQWVMGYLVHLGR
jgi:hypothetical protein